jgi:uncharacterized Fe-S cluster-containing protein|tara:strand:- start:361 stop:531 length:171 start_codon:yes stop_codon:yes gene_type:complete
MEDKNYEQCGEVADWLLNNSEYIFDMAFNEARELFYENRKEFDKILKQIRKEQYLK